MAWYYGEFNCGHEGRVDIGGPGKDRQRKADYFFNGLCDVCKEAEKEMKRKNERIYAENMTDKLALPGLKGTEKQVNWAISIRQNFIDECENVKKVNCHFKQIIGAKLKTEALLYVINYILSNKIEAWFWIENRKKSAVGLVVTNYKEALGEALLKKEYPEFLKI